jgi:CRP-like cAMP-binding protein
VLTAVARALPQLATHSLPSSVPAGGTGYRTSIPLRSPADDHTARATFLRWVWYAARRAGLHLDEADDDFTTPERLEDALHAVAPTLRLTPAEQRDFLQHITIARYGSDEWVQTAGQVPTHMTLVVDGRIQLVAPGPDDAVVPVRSLEQGDFLGQTALTREPVSAGAYAVEEVVVVLIERADIEELVARKPLLLQDIGRAIEERKADVRRALTAVGGE